MDMSNHQTQSLPLGIKVSAGFLILAGALRLVGMVFAVVYTAMKASDMSLALLISYGLRIAGAAMIVFAGVALFQRKRWSRRFALGALAVVGYFIIKRGALLLAYGQPAHAFGLAGPLLALTAFMFFLLTRRSATEALP